MLLIIKLSFASLSPTTLTLITAPVSSTDTLPVHENTYFLSFDLYLLPINLE